MRPHSVEKRLLRLIQTAGFRQLMERLNLLLDQPVWWYCESPHSSIHILESHGKRECGLLHDDRGIRDQWFEATRAATAQVSREKVGLMAASPPDHVQVVVPVICGNEIQGYIGMAHLPAFEQRRLYPLLPLMVDHIRHIADRQRSDEDLKGVQRLWRDVVSTLDLDILEDRILREILSMLDAERGVLLITDYHHRLVPRKTIGFEEGAGPADDYQISAAPYENKMSGWTHAAQILSPGDPLRTWYQSVDRTEEEMGVWAVPLRDSGHLFGMALCPGYEEAELDSHLDMALETLTLGSSVAIRNAQEFEQMRQKAVALSTVHSVYRLMSTTRELRDLLKQMANLTLQVLNVRKCSIMLVEGEDRLKPHVQIGLEKGEVGTRPLRFGEGLPGQVAVSAMSIMVHDPRKDERFAQDPPEFYPSQSYLSVPLFEDDVVGVITVADRIGNPPRFVEGDREVLNTLAEQSVIALQNIQYFEKQERIALRTMETFDNLYEMGDPDKEGHANKLASLIDGLAGYLRIDSQMRQILRMAALIHDVALAIVHQHGPETTIEDSLKHVELSIRMARRLELPESIVPILRDHLEHFDGAGIPRGLKGENIPLGARILALASGYLNFVVPGRGVHGLTPEQALRKLEEESGKRYDPNLIQSLREYLASGEKDGPEDRGDP